ncbi:MAG TPA: 2-hydroxyacid dehydrogenase [Bdellovibrionales bacterium]|jgi:D-lactate dehydrogenase|nr:2-hydroxyacid dehydrogenase [Bdellovibrionales bacterium]
MRVTVFDTHSFDKDALTAANAGRHELHFIEARLTESTVNLAKDAEVVCCFVNDRLNATVIYALKNLGVKLIALRSAGFNHVDMKAAHECHIPVVRVPEYSPHAVAEHAVTLLMTLNRKTHKANNRVRECNFSLDGLVGFDLYQKTVGVIGTGRIGKVFAQIMRGFEANVVAFDRDPDIEWANTNRVRFVSLEELLITSDVISLHVPLNDGTLHLLNEKAFAVMKKTVILVNTGRGALIDTKALIVALKKKSIGGACLDVYEEEEGVFFSDFSLVGIDDDILARLMTFPNVLITSHQAFLTHEALRNIAETTLNSVNSFETKHELGAVLIR